MYYWNVLLRGDQVGTGVFKFVDDQHKGLGIKKEWTVFASVTEMGIIDGDTRPFIGSASISVLSVAPQDNGNVDVNINSDWESKLNLRVSIVAFPPV